LFSVLRQAGLQARPAAQLLITGHGLAWFPLRIVDIATPEFSLAFRHFSGRCRCKLWPPNENLIFENDFNGRGSRFDLKRARPPERKRVRRVTFITSAMDTLTEQEQ
jgi:hypothetical protein